MDMAISKVKRLCLIEPNRRRESSSRLGIRATILDVAGRAHYDWITHAVALQVARRLPTTPDGNFLPIEMSPSPSSTLWALVKFDIGATVHAFDFA